MVSTPGRRQAGRPRAEHAIDLDAVLDVALKAFASHGYEGVSMRMLNSELGVSHNFLTQRFGSKLGLWHAAVDHGFGSLVRHMESVFDPTLSDPLEQLALAVRGLMLYSAHRPELLGLMYVEARLDTERLTYVYETYIAPTLKGPGRLLDHLIAEGRIHPIPLRSLHFLVAHGASAPFTLVPLARHFEPDSPLDEEAIQAHVAMMSDLLIRGLTLVPDAEPGKGS